MMLRTLQALQVLAVLALALLNLAESAALNQRQGALGELKSRHAHAMRQKERLQLSIEQLNAPVRIDVAARQELGLRPALTARTVDVAAWRERTLQVADR